MGLTYEVKVAEKAAVEQLTMLLQRMPGTEPYSMEGYRSGDIRENIRKGRNPTATSQAQFFPPLMIVMVRCRILHRHYARTDIASHHLAVTN